LQAGGRRFDPDRLHQVHPHADVAAHTKIVLYTPGIEAGVVFFDNMVNE
jgi:hypothetical protein